MGPLDLVTETLQEAFCRWQFFYLRVVHALAQIKELQNLLPLCTHCKKIRDGQNYWQQIENYFTRHSKFRFSHSICPQML